MENAATKENPPNAHAKITADNCKGAMKITNKMLILILIILISIIILLSYLKEHAAAEEAAKKKIELPSTHLELWEVPEDTAPANIDNGKPYHSLDLPAAIPQELSQVTAKQCYEMDDSVKMEVLGGGNYSQCTNNYKRESPDSCSAPRHELITSFYQ